MLNLTQLTMSMVTCSSPVQDVAKGETVIKEKEEELYALQEKLVSMENVSFF